MLEHLDIPNPFSSRFVKDPWSDDFIDLPGIHQNVSAKCLQFLNQLRHQGTLSLLVNGNAGSGKTHIIARLRRNLIGPKQRIVMTWVSWDGVNSNELWQALRKALVTDLLRPVSNSLSQLDRVFADKVPAGLLEKSAAGEQGLLGWLGGWISSANSKPQELVRSYVNTIPNLSYDVRAVLPQLYSEHAQAARDWLLEGSLPEEQLQLLGLTRQDSVDIHLESESRKVVLSLLRVMGRSHPLVLCFDQIEGLQAHIDDKPRLAAFGDLFAVLYNFSECSSLLLSFIHTRYRALLKAAVNTAIWQRVSENEVTLNPLSWFEAAELIKIRLNSIPALKSKRRDKPELWPLREDKVQQLYQHMKLDGTPRELLKGCEKLYVAEIEGKPVTSESLDDFLKSEWQKRQEQKLNRLSQDRFVGISLGLPLLLNLMSTQYKNIHSEELQKKLGDVNLIFQTPQGQLIGISICNLSPAELRWRLHRLKKQWSTKYLHQLVLLRGDPTETTVASNNSYRELQSQGVLVVQPSIVKITGLGALQSLMQDALNGNLTCAQGTLKAEEVDRWARMALFEELHPLGVLRDFPDDLGLDVFLPAQRQAISVRTNSQGISS